ncbi:MAG: DUF3486 family protein [Polaromonas sp.]
MTDKSSFKRKPSRPSSITQLDPAIKQAVDTAVREGRATIDEIVRLVEGLGGDASRSAVGRYVKNAREQLEDYRRAQEMAKVWIEKIGKEPEGDVGRLVSEMLKVQAYKTMGSMDEASPQDLMFLGKAIKDVTSADKLAVDKELAIRKLIATEAAKVATEVVKTAKKAGLSDETVELIRTQILGIPEAKKA